LEFVGLRALSSSELVFEALEAGFFTLFVDIGLADILAFVDLVEVRLREVGDFECLVDFGGVDGGDTLPINALVFELFEDGLVVFERPIASPGALNRAILTMDGLIVVEAVEEKRANVLAEIVSIALNIRAESIEIDQLRGFHRFEVGRLVAFEGIDQEQRIRVEWEVGFLTDGFVVLVFDSK